MSASLTTSLAATTSSTAAARAASPGLARITVLSSAMLSWVLDRSGAVTGAGAGATLGAAAGTARGDAAATPAIVEATAATAPGRIVRPLRSRSIRTVRSRRSSNSAGSLAVARTWVRSRLYRYSAPSRPANKATTAASNDLPATVSVSEAAGCPSAAAPAGAVRNFSRVARTCAISLLNAAIC